MRQWFYDLYGQYFGKDNLYLGCGMDREDSRNGHRWINLDINAGVLPDVVHDLNHMPLPFRDNEFDCVFSCHCLEHLDRMRFVECMADIHRILRPNGAFIGITPYGASDCALGMPQHRQAFFELTWAAIDPRTYQIPGQFGEGDDEGMPLRIWNQVEMHLVPKKEYENDPELEWKAHHLRNVIDDMHIVMRAVK
jgi:SAM-dependent methyltransferase